MSWSDDECGYFSPEYFFEADEEDGFISFDDFLEKCTDDNGRKTKYLFPKDTRISKDFKSLKLGKKFRYLLSNETFNCFSELTSLSFATYNKTWKTGMLPETLTSLSFAKGFNKCICRGMIPPNLRTLCLGNDFNKLLENWSGVFPKSLTYISFGDSFNRPLKRGMLPPNIQGIYLGKSFNEDVEPGALPESLKNIVFGNSFNVSLEVGVFHHLISSVDFGDSFNQQIKPGTFVCIEEKVNTENKSARFQGVASIKFGKAFNNFGIPFINGVFPDSVTKLEFGQDFNQVISKGVLPRYLKELYFGNYSNGSTFDQPFDVGVLPSFLISLFFTKYRHRLKAGVLPDSLIYLKFSERFDVRLIDDNALPKKLKIFWSGNDCYDNNDQLVTQMCRFVRREHWGTVYDLIRPKYMNGRPITGAEVDQFLY